MVNNLGFVHMHMKCQSGKTADTLAALSKQSIGVRPHKEKINISKEIINKTR